MINKMGQLLKRIKDNYVRNWNEQDKTERYGGMIFAIVVLSISFFAPENVRQEAAKYMNLLSILFVVFLYRNVRKSKRAVVEKNKEIEYQKQLIEHKQKEIIDSINYARRIQMTLITSEKYIQEKLQQLKK
jgi:hypothetical protein